MSVKWSRIIFFVAAEYGGYPFDYSASNSSALGLIRFSCLLIRFGLCVGIACHRHSFLCGTFKTFRFIACGSGIEHTRHIDYLA